MLPDNFYDRVEQGSIILKKSPNFCFSKEGLIIEGESRPLETDIVILATGFRGDQKLKNMFKSPVLKNRIVGSPGPTAPLYWQIIHPRIPQLAVIGYAESLSNMFSSEIRCQWLAHFLSGNFELPSIREIEKDVTMWENGLKQYSGKYFGRSCYATVHFWYNDHLCKDMGCNPRRKKGILAEWFVPHLPTDYAGLTINK